MYHQVLNIGEWGVPCVIEYSDDETGVFVIDKISTLNGHVEIPVGVFEMRQIEDICDKLAKRHDHVVSDLNATYRADRAADRAAFHEAYGA